MAKRIILDGGMGRELKRIGAPFRQPEWSALALMQAPETVVDVHRSFIRAGAQVITTNNYAVVPYHLGENQFEADGLHLTALAGELALRAAEDTAVNGVRSVKVGGSLPPLSGSYRPDFFNPLRASQLYPSLVNALDPFVDLWQAETMASLDEAQAVVSAVEHSAKPLWISFTLIDEPDLETPQLRSGESLEAALQLAIDANAEALMFNCSLPEVIGLAIAAIAPTRDNNAPHVMLGGYGNAFTPRMPDAEANRDSAQLRGELTPEHYRDLTRQWESDGANIIGGCCGVGPDHIALL